MSSGSGVAAATGDGDGPVGQGQQATNWCGTFNYGSRSVDGTPQPFREGVDRWVEHALSQSKYFVAGFECAPTTGQTHLQFYLQLKKRARLTQLKRWPDGASVHWEIARGDEIQNREYCLGLSDGKQPNTETIEEGEATPVHAGIRERRRWSDTIELIKKGKFEEVDPQIQIQYCKNLAWLEDRYQPEDQDLPHGFQHEWLWGPTGTGKSHTARDEILAWAMSHDTTPYIKLHNKWFDHWKRGQPIIIDDLGIEVGKALTDHLKQWCDRYVFAAEKKGGVSGKGIRPPKVWITSNYHPWDIWGGGPSENADYHAVMRRFHVRFLGRPGESAPGKGPAELVLPVVLRPGDGAVSAASGGGEGGLKDAVLIVRPIDVVDLTADTDPLSDCSCVHTGPDGSQQL